MLLAEPLAVRIVRVGCCGVVAWVCFYRSAQLNPLLPRAYALDAVALPFAGAAVADTLVSVLVGLARYFAGRL
jgi:hypothetical protein